jgi:hypothetical protein
MPLAVRLFLEPLKLWDHWVWLLVPLCIGVALVYKSMRIESMRRVPLEAFKFTVWVLLGMSAAAVGLALLVRFQAG